MSLIKKIVLVFFLILKQYLYQSSLQAFEHYRAVFSSQTVYLMKQNLPF